MDKLLFKAREFLCLRTCLDLETKHSSSPPPRGDPVSHLQQLVLLTLPLSHVLVECNCDPLGLSAAPGADAQLGQLVTHGAMKRGEVLGYGSLPPHFLSTHRRGAGRLLDLRQENNTFKFFRRDCSQESECILLSNNSFRII